MRVDDTTVEAPRRLLRVLLAGGLLALGWLAIDLVTGADSAAASVPDLTGTTVIDDVDDAVTTVVSDLAEPVATVTAPIVATAIETLGDVVVVIDETADQVVPGVLPPLPPLPELPDLPGLPDLGPIVDPLLALPGTLTAVANHEPVSAREIIIAGAASPPLAPPSDGQNPPVDPAEAPAAGQFVMPGAELSSGVSTNPSEATTSATRSDRAPAAPVFDTDTTPD
jgi:hypothetical protein